MNIFIMLLAKMMCMYAPIKVKNPALSIKVSSVKNQSILSLAKPVVAIRTMALLKSVSLLG